MDSSEKCGDLWSQTLEKGSSDELWICVFPGTVGLDLRKWHKSPPLPLAWNASPWNRSAVDRPSVLIAPSDLHRTTFQTGLIDVVAVGALAVEGSRPEHLLGLSRRVSVRVVAYRRHSHMAACLAPTAQWLAIQLRLACALPARGAVQLGEGTTAGLSGPAAASHTHWSAPAPRTTKPRRIHRSTRSQSGSMPVDLANHTTVAR